MTVVHTTTDDPKAIAEATAKADKEFRGFFFVLGHAISRWAHVDRALFDFCQFALQTNEMKTAVVFYRTPSIGDHLSLVDQLMQLSLRKSRLTEWKTIHAGISDLLPFRNDIAHNPSTETIEIIGVINPSNNLLSSDLKKRLEEPSKQWWSVQTEPKKLLLRKSRSVKARREDIIKHLGAVNQILSAIWALQRRLPKKPTRTPPISVSQGSPHRSGQAKKSHRSSTKPQRQPRSS